MALWQGLVSLGILFCSYLFWSNRRQWTARNPRGLPFPPGPKGLPVIGSVLDMPMIKPWIVYNQWSKRYGSDMVFFKVLDRSFLVLNSLQATQDLLVKRSEKYSDRPRMPMILEVMKYGWSMGFIGYGDRWREQKKAFTKHFNHTVVSKYHDIQIREARAFILRMLKPNASSELIPNIRQMFAALIMDVSYGIRVSDSSDPYVVVAEKAMDGLNEAAVPGAFWVDIMPFLKYVPKWMPGAGWKKKAELWTELSLIFVAKPFEAVKAQMEKGEAKESIVTDLLTNLPPEGDSKREIKEEAAQNVPATAYLGGSDTIVCSLESFFVAMCLYPEVQRKAQAELDEIMSTTHSLPTFADRPRLNYISAIVEESLRWQIVAPLGLPHVLTDDDEYKGYFIPKGTLVLGNSWSILHNPDEVTDPSKFMPERYMTNGKFNPTATLSTSFGSFGFGRRGCPGQHFTRDALFSMIASTLAVYNITPKKDETGKEVPVSDDVVSAFVSHPVPFECSLTVRSPQTEQLVQNSVEP